MSEDSEKVIFKLIKQNGLRSEVDKVNIVFFSLANSLQSWIVYSFMSFHGQCLSHQHRGRREISQRESRERE